MAIARSRNNLNAGLAALDSLGRVAQKMRQTHLPKDAMATLASQHVGDPYDGPRFSKQSRYKRLASAGLDDVQHS
jgi:hypothetical protein